MSSLHEQEGRTKDNLVLAMTVKSMYLKEYVSLTFGNCPSTDVILGDTSKFYMPISFAITCVHVVS